MSITMSECGRTARQHGTGGIAHGHAEAMVVIGGSLKLPRKVNGAGRRCSFALTTAEEVPFKSAGSEMLPKYA